MTTHAKLTQPQYFELRTWTLANAETLKPLDSPKHAAMAAEALGFSIPKTSVQAMRRDMGWNEKPNGCPDTARQLEDLTKRVERLEARLANLQSPSLL